MEPSEAIETGSKIMTWFTDYGALQILAALFIIRVILDWVGGWWLVKTYGFVIAELVTLLREKRKVKRNGHT